MKTVLKMAWTMTDDPTLKRHVSTGYVLLANFRDDIERPIDLTLRAAQPVQADLKTLEPFLAIAQQVEAESDKLMNEFREFESGKR
jgi:hypothetical protein